MNWLNEMTDIAQKYGAGAPANIPGSVHDDFDRVSRSAPPATMSDALAEAFRSDRTAPFPQMLSQLFGRSPSAQKNNVLGALIASLGPALVSQILARHGAARAAKEIENGKTQISPDIADQIPASSIEVVAAEAEKKDPSIMDRVSQYYAEQPALVKTLGGLALTVALARMAQRQSAR